MFNILEIKILCILDAGLNQAAYTFLPVKFVSYGGTILLYLHFKAKAYGHSLFGSKA
jgi:hypothetical protein